MDRQMEQDSDMVILVSRISIYFICVCVCVWGEGGGYNLFYDLPKD